MRGRRPSGPVGCRPRRVGLSLLLAAALVGCAQAPVSPSASPGASRAGSTSLPSPPGNTVPPLASPAPAASGACSLPSLSFRAAQVLLVGIPGTTANDGGDAVVRAGVGGVVLFGGNLVDARQVRTLTAGLQHAAKVPLAIAMDEEPGRIGRLATAGIIPATPSARVLGKSAATVVEARAKQIGTAMADLGLTVDLAPVLDVSGGPALGVIGDRSFGSDPATVARGGVAFAEGLAAAGIAAVGKHFPGHGETTVDSHTSLPVVTAPLDALRRRALVPFAAAIDAGIPAIMLGHLQVDAIDPSRPASVSAKAVRLLRREMGFTGLVMTDDIYMAGITDRWQVPEAVELALRAGVDMVILSSPADVGAVKKALVAAVGAGRLTEARLNEAFLRVERFKGVERWAACRP